MIIHFKRDEVEKLFAHTVAAANHKPLYEQPETKRPGLWLVGDDGVYLMSNAEELLPSADCSDVHFVAYADEANPKTCPDSVWENKRVIFGGDDGCEFIAAQLNPGESTEMTIAAWLENSWGPFLTMNLTPDNMEVVYSDPLKEGLPPAVEGQARKLAGPEFDKYFIEGLRWIAWTVPTKRMDREGLIAYIGVLKAKEAEMTEKIHSLELHARAPGILKNLNKACEKIRSTKNRKRGADPKGTKGRTKPPAKRVA